MRVGLSWIQLTLEPGLNHLPRFGSVNALSPLCLGTTWRWCENFLTCISTVIHNKVCAGAASGSFRAFVLSAPLV